MRSQKLLNSDTVVNCQKDDGGSGTTANHNKLHMLRMGIKSMHANFLVKRAICSELEEIADDLPMITQKQRFLHLGAIVLPAVRRAHEFEEIYMFPCLQSFFCDDPRLEKTLERLRLEHCEDECCAEEVSAVLLDCGHSGSIKNPEMFGYLLRTFFEGLRRHIAFEQDHIVPIAEGIVRLSLTGRQ